MFGLVARREVRSDYSKLMERMEIIERNFNIISDDVHYLKNKENEEIVGYLYGNDNNKQTVKSLLVWFPASVYPYNQELNNNKWFQFTQKDIQDRHADEIKIFNVWHKKENVVFLNEYVENRKREIEERNKKQAKK